MLHTFIGRDRAHARSVARGPMRDYLRAAAGLIKQYAWAFPAFKKPQGITNPMDIDIQSLAPEEMDAILDFAFDRYLKTPACLEPSMTPSRGSNRSNASA